MKDKSNENIIKSNMPFEELLTEVDKYIGDYKAFLVINASKVKYCKTTLQKYRYKLNYDYKYIKQDYNEEYATNLKINSIVGNDDTLQPLLNSERKKAASFLISNKENKANEIKIVIGLTLKELYEIEDRGELSHKWEKYIEEYIPTEKIATYIDQPFL